MNRSVLLRAPVAACALLVASATPIPARAQPARDPAAAESLFRAGLELLERDDWAGACAKFAASQDLDPAVSTLAKLAKCREHEGRLAEAWYTLQQALKLNSERTGQNAKRQQELDAFMKAQLAALEPRVPRLRIVVKGATEGVEVTRNGKPLPASALGEALPVDPGEHEAVATARGFAPGRRSATVGEGETTEMIIELGPAAVAAPAAAAASAAASADRSASDPGRGRRTAGFVVGGVGVAGLAVGGVLGVLTVVKAGGAAADASGNVDREAARTRQTAAFVTAGVGLAAFGAGLALVLTAPSKKAAVGVAVAPSAVSVAGAW